MSHGQEQHAPRETRGEDRLPCNQRQLHWVHELYEIGRGIASDDPEKIQQRLLDHVVKGFSAVSGSIALKEGGGYLRLVAGSGTAASYVGSRIRIGEPVLGWVVQHNEAVLLNGAISEDARFRGSAAVRRKERPVSSMCWPLAIDNQVLGAISVNRGDGEAPFQDEDLEHGAMMLGIVSLVVDNMRLHQVQQGRIRELSDMNRQLEEQQEELMVAHRERAASEARLSSILDIAPTGIIAVDRAGTITMFNKGAERIFGYTASEVIGQSHELLLPERLREAHRRHVEAFAGADTMVRYMEERREIVGRRKDGSEFPAAAGVAKVTTEDGMLYTVVISDVTEQRQAEAALRKEKEEQELLVQKLQDAQSQLLQSEKMASIGQLAAGVAHEINNPVGYINSNLGTLRQYVDDLFCLVDGYESVEKALAKPEAFESVSDIRTRIDLDYLRSDLQDLLQETQDGVLRVRQIVQDLKDFSHVDEADWQWADIHAGLDSTLNIAHNELKYKAEVIKEYGDLPEVECIISQLNQVFMNLLVNAAQAIEEHGTITVRSGREGEGVWVEIEDTGKGMDDETQKRIFDPFFTTKPVGKGTGLGLSLSYNIIKKHHGKFTVSSEVGKGTTFRIWLPARQAEQRAGG